MGWDDLIGCIGYNTPLHFERSMLGLNISENEHYFVYQQHSKSMWIGIGLIVAGFFITFWQNIYGISSGFRGIPILALFLLPISIIGVGFGIVAHYFWKQYKEYSKTFKKKKGFEA